jgi:hypothetical protein
MSFRNPLFPGTVHFRASVMPFFIHALLPLLFIAFPPAASAETLQPGLSKELGIALNTQPCQPEDLPGRWAMANMASVSPKTLTKDQLKQIMVKSPDFYPYQVFVFRPNGQAQMMRLTRKPSEKELKVLANAFTPEYNPLQYSVTPAQALLTFKGKRTAPMKCFKVLTAVPKYGINQGNLLWDYDVTLSGHAFTLMYLMMPL